MQIINKKTGEDVTKYVLLYLENKITVEEYKKAISEIQKKRFFDKLKNTSFTK